MKKCILSAIAGALMMLVAIIIAARISAAQEQTPKEYEHIDYVSNVTQEECFVCGTNNGYSYWGEDNVGIVNLNNFDLLYLEINHYGDGRELIQEPAGVMLSCGIMDEEADTYAHAYVFPDNAYATLQITGMQYAINREMIQSWLCQACLDSINNL